MMTYLCTGNTVQNYIQIAITRVYVPYAFETMVTVSKWNYIRIQYDHHEALLSSSY